MDKQQTPFVENFFKEAIDREMLRFTRKPQLMGNEMDLRLDVEYKDIKNAAPKEEKDYGWRLLVAMYAGSYAPDDMIQRIVFRMLCNMQSLSQDINIIHDEYELQRR